MTLPPTTPPTSPSKTELATSYSGLAVQEGTLSRAAILGAGILAVVAVIAWFGFSRDATPPLDSYLRRGPAGAATALKRDLQAEFPSGPPVTPLVQRLKELGMACSQVAESRAQWDCAIMTRVEPRRSLQLRVTIATLGDRITALDTNATERAQ